MYIYIYIYVYIYIYICVYVCIYVYTYPSSKMCKLLTLLIQMCAMTHSHTLQIHDMTRIQVNVTIRDTGFAKMKLGYFSLLDSDLAARYICTYIYIYIHIYIFLRGIYIYVVYIYIFIYMYIYTYTHIPFFLMYIF